MCLVEVGNSHVFVHPSEKLTWPKLSLEQVQAKAAGSSKGKGDSRAALAWLKEAMNGQGVSL